MSFKFSKKNSPDATYKNRKFDHIEQNYDSEVDELNLLESIPPSYFDLGKRARDLFTNGYHFGLLSLNIITKSPNKVSFTTTCVENLNQGSLFGSLEAKYEFPNSLTLTEKWNTDCTVTTELTCKNKPFRGCRVTCSGSICPRTGDKFGTIKAEWANKFCSLNTQLALGSKFSDLTSSLVLGYRGILGGVLTKLDVQTLNVSVLNFAAGFSSNDFILHTSFNNGTECEGSIFHRVSPKADAGVDVIYSTRENSDILFGVAGRYQVDEDVYIRGKINNFCMLGLSFEQKLRDSIILTLSALFDVRNFAGGKHKFGLSIQFES